MKQQFFGLGLSAGLALSLCSTAGAVQPAPVEGNANVQWSKVISDPFDGTVVYDKNFSPSDHGYVFVTSWSKGGIRATYTWYESAIDGYRTVWRSRWVHRKGKKVEEQYPEQEPVYRYTRFDDTPKAIMFAVNGQLYTYEDGAIAPELVTALANAPAGNMRIRLVWNNGKTKDIEIGKGTVEAWKTVFRDRT
ncbi:hypothetical protein [Stenomitos frigidus]|uniref:DUF3047 domain-containing protein n=1 Tax=Stenomitos frigidus ULC18 TaxID=2107698 RepID=A0A2T1DZ50_9CYAN|nr:hypothetical protein [Stenomitos frigidus]PSB25654.1 hypothetical protein C7B82_22825 [Stenomitos frigidus ULC18]